MNTLKSLWESFLKDKTSISLKEGSYLPLNDSSVLYFIEEGVADLYAFASDNIQEKETANYINTFEEGEVLFGFNAEVNNQNFFLRAHSHSSLKKCSLEEWITFNKENPDSSGFKEVLENWISTLEASLERKERESIATKVEPLQKVHLDKDQMVLLTFETEIRKTAKVLWIFVEKGALIINNEKDIQLFSKDGGFPVLEIDEIKAFEESEFSIKTTDQIIEAGISPQFLDLFYKNFLRRTKKQKEVSNKESTLQLLSDISLEKRLVQNSCYILSKVLSHASEIPLTFSEDDLIKACQYLAVKLGGYISCERFSPTSITIEEKIREIAQKSSLSYREVKLTTELFVHDFDPIIVFNAKTDGPMVLFYTGKKKYKVFDPKTNAEIDFCVEDLKDLSSKGYVLYKDLPKTAKGIALFKFIFEKQWLDIGVVIAVGIGTAIISLYTPIAMQFIFDNAVPNHDEMFLLHIVGGLLAVGVGSSLFSLTRAFAILRLEGKTANKLQAALWTRLLNLKLPFFKCYSIGDLYQRVSAVDEIRSILGGNTLNTVVSSLFACLYFVVMLMKSVSLSMIMLIPVGLTMIIYVITIAMTIKRELHVLNVQATIYGFFVQIIESIRNIRVFNAENRAFAKWSALFADKKKKEIELMAIQNWLMVSHSMIVNMGQLMMYFVVIHFLTSAIKTPGSPDASFLKIGEFLSFSSAYGFFSAAVFSIGSALLSILQDIIPRWIRAKSLLEAEAEKRQADAHFEKIYGEITVDNLSFRYTEKMPLLLKNLSLRIKKGSFVGIIGASGAGKSTLVNLLLGFEKPYRGAISFDDRLLETFDITFLRQQIGSVLQHGSILSGSIRENIICARTYSDEEIMKVLSVCCLDEDIENLPMKLETVVPPGGGTLSEGQRQRLLLARSLIQKPNILIIDDALNALDLNMQEQIKKNIEEMNMTRIVLSNKIAAIKNVEWIYVMDKGEIVESGSYETLVNKKGVFARMVKEQTL